jgi:hypothetical protein
MVKSIEDLEHTDAIGDMGRRFDGEWHLMAFSGTKGHLVEPNDISVHKRISNGTKGL